MSIKNKKKFLRVICIVLSKAEVKNTCLRRVQKNNKSHVKRKKMKKITDKPIFMGYRIAYSVTEYAVIGKLKKKNDETTPIRF